MSAEQNAPRQPGHFYHQLATEQVNPATRDIDRMTTLEMVRAMNAEDASVAGAVARALPQIAGAIEAIAARLRRGGRLIYMGAGTSGRLGVLDASECPPTFNVSPDMIVGCVAGGPIALARSQEDQEDSAEGGQADAARLHIGEADALVGITASGRTAYVLGATAYAREHGALTIGLVCNPGSPLEAQADMTIITVVGPEVISGSTRLKAGTAQKMVLNMLSTGVMVLLGKTFGNLMVDVQATNQKLHQRAITIVQQAAGLEHEAAESLLSASGGEVKTAILAAQANIAPEEARARLAAHDGVLSAALDAQP